MKENLMKTFKTHLKILGYSKSSQTMLPACVLEFLEQNKAKKITEITQNDISEHYEYLSTRPNKRRAGGLSSRTINHNIYAIKLFLNYLEQIGKIQENPISGMSFPKPESKTREILTKEEIQELYKTAESYKEKTILGVYYACGLRRTEGEALNLKDISFREKLLYVRQGKGKKRRVIPINKRTIEDFKNYVYNERFTTIENQTAFICNSLGRRMSGASSNEIVKKIVEKSNIKKEITLHNLRHTIATQLLNNGMSIEYVRDFLGHKHLEATQIYTHVNKF